MKNFINTITAIAIILVFFGIGLTDNGLNEKLDPNNKESNQTEQGNNKPSDTDSIFDMGKSELEADEAVVTRVIDGDTILAITSEPDENGKVHAKEERIRLLLIDTPESVHPDGKIEAYGVEASDYAKEYIKAGQKIRVEKGIDERDKYDRLLAYIWVDDVNFNLHMIEKGFARVAYVYEPNTKYIDDFRKAEKQAKKNKLNIWSVDGYVTDKGFNMSVFD